MLLKDNIRKRYQNLKKKKYFEVSIKYFKPIIDLLNSITKTKKTYLSLYYPSNFEVNTLELFKSISSKKNLITLLPSISSNKNMKFYRWNFLDNLKVNQYGMLEPVILKKPIVPNIILVPIIAFDNDNNRLGYGKGYYDKFLNKYLKLNLNILTVGVAFSFQKYKKLPSSNFDVKLNYILTEKGLK